MNPGQWNNPTLRPMGNNLPTQAQIETQRQMAPWGRGQWNKHQRKPYLERGFDGQKLMQEIVDMMLCYGNIILWKKNAHGSY